MKRRSLSMIMAVIMAVSPCAGSQIMAADFSDSAEVQEATAEDPEVGFRSEQAEAVMEETAADTTAAEIQEDKAEELTDNMLPETEQNAPKEQTENFGEAAVEMITEVTTEETVYDAGRTEEAADDLVAVA